MMRYIHIDDALFWIISNVCNVRFVICSIVDIPEDALNEDVDEDKNDPDKRISSESLACARIMSNEKEKKMQASKHTPKNYLEKVLRAIPLKKVSGGGDHTPQKILRMGGPENFAILQVGDPENFVILRVGGKVRPP